MDVTVAGSELISGFNVLTSEFNVLTVTCMDAHAADQTRSGLQPAGHGGSGASAVPAQRNAVLVCRARRLASQQHRAGRVRAAGPPRAQ
eukprot:1689155-Rhodomonas_salina.4